MNDRIIIATSQLGYRLQSIKQVSLVCAHSEHLPDSIPFYIQTIGSRLKRSAPKPPAWSDETFRWPYDLLEGEILPDIKNYASFTEEPLYRGELKKTTHRWGTFWQAEFSDFQQSGIFQVETPYGMSTPFEIQDKLYDRVIRSYMISLNAQRSGCDIFGVRMATHLDDAVIPETGNQIDVTGGWYDAGDFRKWMALDLIHLDALGTILDNYKDRLAEQVIDEINWGNRYFQNMMNAQGQVYEDVGGGAIRAGFDYDDGWWFENHPGCIADNSGNYYTDNIPETGDERHVRTTYNPYVQYTFVRTQARLSRQMPDKEAAVCRECASKAWQYAAKHPHDDRSLFLASELHAAVALWQVDPSMVDVDHIKKLATRLLDRQMICKDGLSHFFTEKDRADGYRSIVYSCDPLDAIIELWRIAEQLGVDKARLQEAITAYIEQYLIKDAATNPFMLTPYGVYFKTPHSEHQLFREAGGNKYVRTFIHPFNEQEIVHGSNSVVMHQAYMMAKCAKLMDKPEYINHAERLIHWATGHNPNGLTLFSGLGYKYPVYFSAASGKMPEIALAGFIGRPDDTPYQETSNATEWSTQEVWGVPFVYLAQAVCWLNLCANNS